MPTVRRASAPCNPSPTLCPGEREDEPSLRELVRDALILAGLVPLVDFATEDDGPSVKVTLLHPGFLERTLAALEDFEGILVREHRGDRPPPTTAPPGGNSSQLTPARLRELGTQASARLCRRVAVTSLRVAVARTQDAMLHTSGPCPLLLAPVRDGLHGVMAATADALEGADLASLSKLAAMLRGVLAAVPEAWRVQAETLVGLGAVALDPPTVDDDALDEMLLASDVEFDAVVRNEPPVAYWLRKEPSAATKNARRNVPVDFTQPAACSRRQISMSHDTRTTNTVGTNRSRLSAQVAA